MKIFLQADKGSIVVVINKKEITDGKDSYEAKMKPVLEANFITKGRRTMEHY